MKRKIVKIIWMFVIGSFLGYLLETLLVISRGAFEVRKGLIYGPFIPVYGIGGVMYYLVLSSIKFKEDTKVKNILIAFVLTFLMGGLTEYVCSVVQELCFGTVSWDYSYLPFNFSGRTSIFHSFCWGLLGVAFYLTGLPLLEKADSIIDKKVTIIMTVLITIFMLFDITISSLACYRKYERRMDIAPTNRFEVFLDNYYTDEFLNLIYVNSQER